MLMFAFNPAPQVFPPYDFRFLLLARYNQSKLCFYSRFVVDSHLGNSSKLDCSRFVVGCFTSTLRRYDIYFWHLDEMQSSAKYCKVLQSSFV